MSNSPSLFMVFPNFKNKHLADALFHPTDYVNYKKWDKSQFPTKYLLIYQSTPYRHILRKFKGKYKKITLYSKLSIIKIGKIGVIKMSGIGAPYSSTIIEELIALGGRKFINIGTAGGLRHEGIFLCNKAIRDEGTSYHYIPHEKYSYPDKILTKKLGNLIKKNKLEFSIAPTWTIDAPYRETKKEAAHYKKEGVATVEMEASALFAVASVRKVKIAAAFVVSDVLGEKWDPKFHHINLKKNLDLLFEAAVDAFGD